MVEYTSFAVETLGPMDSATYSLLYELGRKFSVIAGEDRESSFLFQRLSVLIQRYNANLLHQSFTEKNRPDDDL